MSVQRYIQEGTKVYCKTQYAPIDLLCTVVMLDNCNAKVKLPCKIKGHTHDMVKIMDLRVIAPKQEVRAEPIAYHKSPETNPFRMLVESLKPIDEPEVIIENKQVHIEEKNIDEPQPMKTTMDDSYTGLSSDERDFINGLSEQDRKAYMELWK